MTGQRVLDLLMSRFGGRDADTELRAKAALEMELAQVNLENGEFLPWFLLSEDATVASDAEERRVQVPTDFLREHDEGDLMFQDAEGKWQPLDKDDYDILLAKWTFDGTGEFPEQYSIVGEYFTLFPTPTQSINLRLTKYYARDAAPTDTSAENKWLKYAPDLLMNETGFIVASQHIKDMELAGVFKAGRDEALKKLFKAHVAREEANRMRSMGED